MRKQGTDWGKVYAKHISKRTGIGIHKEHPQSLIRMQKKPHYLKMRKRVQ